jgi:hypothetical protein
MYDLAARFGFSFKVVQMCELYRAVARYLVAVDPPCNETDFDRWKDADYVDPRPKPLP